MVPGTWFGLVGYAATAMAFSFAVFLLHANPHAAANRRLALVLFFEGVLTAFIGTFLLFRVAGAGIALSAAAVPWFYLLFVGTLRFPWIGPLAGANVHRIILTGLILVLVIDSVMLIADPPAADLVKVVLGPGAYALASLYALAASIAAYRHAPRGTATRSQARAFVAAFGVRDLLFAIFFFLVILNVFRDGSGYGFSLPGGHLIVPPIILLIYIPLVAYGILRWQLLDIDLKVKWTFRRGTVLAVLAAAFFLAKETIEAFVPGEGMAANIGAAGLVAALLWPAWLATGALAERMMPGVDRTPGHLESRKADVYRAMFEEALADGRVRQKERAMLDGLAAQLGIGLSEASRLEAAARDRLGKV